MVKLLEVDIKKNIFLVFIFFIQKDFILLLCGLGAIRIVTGFSMGILAPGMVLFCVLGRGVTNLEPGKRCRHWPEMWEKLSNNFHGHS